MTRRADSLCRSIISRADFPAQTTTNKSTIQDSVTDFKPRTNPRHAGQRNLQLHKPRSRSCYASVNTVTVSADSVIGVNLALSVPKSVEAIDLPASTVAAKESSTSDLLPVDGRRSDLAGGALDVDALMTTLVQSSQLSYPNVMREGSGYNESFPGGIRGGDRSSQAFRISLETVPVRMAGRPATSSTYGRVHVRTTTTAPFYQTQLRSTPVSRGQERV